MYITEYKNNIKYLYRKYYYILKMVLKNIPKWHKLRYFWIFITAFCAVSIVFSCLLFDNFFGVMASDEFKDIRLAFFSIITANIVCIVKPKKLISQIISNGVGLFGSIWGIKSCCTLWAMYTVSNLQDFIVSKKSMFEIGKCFLNIGKKCGNENITAINNAKNGAISQLVENSQESVMVTISQHTFTYALYVYMAIFIFVLLTLYTALTRSVMRKS